MVNIRHLGSRSVTKTQRQKVIHFRHYTKKLYNFSTLYGPMCLLEILHGARDTTNKNSEVE